MQPDKNTPSKLKNLLHKKTLLIAGGFLIVALGIIFILFIAEPQPNKQTDMIVKLIPAETIVYSHFYLNGESAMENKIVNAFFANLSAWPEFAKDKLERDILPNLSEEFALALIPNSENKLSPVLYVKVSSAMPNSTDYLSFQDKSIIAFADQTILNNNFTLEEKNNYWLPQNRFDLNNYFPTGNNHFNQTFVETNWLLKNYDLFLEENNPSAKLILNFLKENNLKKVLVKTDIINGSAILNVITSPSLLPEPKSDWQSEPIINQLKNNFLLYFRGSENSEINDLAKNLIDNESYGNLGAILSTLLNNEKLEIIISENDKKLSYFIASPQEENLENKINEVKSAVSEYLTAALPKEQEKILPDRTKVTELILNPEAFQFQKINLLNQNLKNLYLLNAPEINKQIILGYDENNIFLSNSEEIINQYLNNSKTEEAIAIDTIINDCYLSNKADQLLFFNLNSMPEIDKFLFNGQNLFSLLALELNNSNIKGCLK
jgi:hypothetical protein